MGKDHRRRGHQGIAAGRALSDLSCALSAARGNRVATVAAVDEVHVVSVVREHDAGQQCFARPVHAVDQPAFAVLPFEVLAQVPVLRFAAVDHHAQHAVELAEIGVFHHLVGVVTPAHGLRVHLAREQVGACQVEQHHPCEILDPPPKTEPARTYAPLVAELARIERQAHALGAQRVVAGDVAVDLRDLVGQLAVAGQVHVGIAPTPQPPAAQVCDPESSAHPANGIRNPRSCPRTGPRLPEPAARRWPADP